MDSKMEPMPSPQTLRALAKDLPAEQDAQLAKMLEAALKKTRRNGLTSKYLLGEFASERYTDQAFDDILSTLRTDNPRLRAERVVCAWILGVAPLRPHHRLEAADVLNNLLHSRSACQELRKDRYARAWIRSYKFSLNFCGVAAFGFGFGLLIAGEVGLSASLQMLFLSLCAAVLFAFPLSVLVYPVLLPFSLRWDRSETNPLRFMAARSLGRLGLVGSLDALAKACLDKSEGVRRISETALRALLPLLTPEHHGQLGAELVPDLCRALAQADSRLFDPEGHATLLCAELLNALEKIGDSRAIPAMQQIVRNGRTGGLKAQAHRILSILEARERLEIEHDTLLRGAVMPLPRSDQLLRPAAALSDTHPEQLLRPTASRGE